MSENDDKDSKTEQPTEKKLKDAADKGQVPNSRELPIVVSLIVFATYTGFLLNGTAQNLGMQFGILLEHAGDISLDTALDMQNILRRTVISAALVVGSFFLCLMIAGLIASGAQSEPRMVVDRIKPKFERLSLSKGLNRVFGKQGLVEFGKNVGKITIAGTVVAFGLWSSRFVIFKGSIQETGAYLVKINSVLAGLLGYVCAAMVLLAVFDVFWSRFSWLQNLKMSQHEVKTELKQSEGDPILKARLRSLARDRSRHRMFEAVPFATLVVTNPTHVAVALRFDTDSDEAPIVVAKGQDLIAQRIKQIATENEIPMFEQIHLARSLNKGVEIGQTIPADFYTAVAELINYIYTKTAFK